MKLIEKLSKDAILDFDDGLQKFWDMKLNLPF